MPILNPGNSPDLHCLSLLQKQKAQDVFDLCAPKGLPVLGTLTQGHKVLALLYKTGFGQDLEGLNLKVKGATCWLLQEGCQLRAQPCALGRRGTSGASRIPTAMGRRGQLWCWFVEDESHGAHEALRGLARAACSAAQPHPHCCPAFRCLRRPRVCLAVQRHRCRAAQALHRPRPCGSVSDTGLSGREQVRKPRSLLPPHRRCRRDPGCRGHAAAKPLSPRPPRLLRVPLPLPAGVIYTVSCPGKFRSLTFPGWFPLSCLAPIGSSHRAPALLCRHPPVPAGSREVPAGPGEGAVPPSGRTDRAQPAWERWRTRPRVHPSAWVLPRGRTAGGREDAPGHRCGAFGFLPNRRPPLSLPSPPLVLPTRSRLACASPPFPSPSHPAANKMAAAWPFCFPSGKGEARTLGLGSFLEPNSPVSTWHRL